MHMFGLYRGVVMTLTALLLLTASAAAQQVVVVGAGIDRETALRDASRNAVEQVVGTLVDSRTLAQNAAVQLDEIYTKSQGFVTDIKLLSQTNQAGIVRIRAQVEVNTNPDAQLMSKLNMLMMLNDPRIAVAILRQDAQGRILGHDAILEAALNNRLIQLGFSHVVDAGLVSSLQDATLLNEIYNGGTAITAVGQSLGVDYLVIGRTRTQSQAISLPDGNSGYAPTLLKTGNAVMTAKVLKFDTGEIAGTFTVSAKGVENNNEMAEQKATEKMSEAAAGKLEEKFRHLSAVSTCGLQLEVYTADYDAVSQLVKDLQGLSGVQQVYLREHAGNKSIISVDTIVKPDKLVQILKGNSSLGIFVAGISNNTVKLSISR